MKVIVFGATGGSGQELATQAIAGGHQVTALVRSPDRIPAPLAERITIVVGNVFDVAAVTAAVRDHDAVLSALGTQIGRADVAAFMLQQLTADT